MSRDGWPPAGPVRCASTVRLIPLDLSLVDAALAGDQALAEAVGCAVAPGWVTFTGALELTREQLSANPGGVRWGPRLFVGGDPPEVVGWGGFKGPPADGVVEIGYEIASPLQGRGLATGAARAMLREAFADDDVATVIAHTLAETNASNHILENLGFEHDGERDDDGTTVWRYVLRRSSAGDREQPVATDVFLETDRLVLRRFTTDDLALIAELDGDPEVKRYIDGGAAVDREDLAETLAWWLGYYERYEGYGFWAAIEKSSGEFVGWFHLRPPEGASAAEPELGYRLRQAVWGRGYATEGSRALVDKAFSELGAERVNASTMVVNRASQRVMEKSGLRHVRTFHADWPVSIPGDEHGDVEYAVDRAQWEQDRAGR
jgi:RimJ/RimL family protein N-acetyltransferase